MLFGSHLSIAGGVVNALNEAESLGLDTVQIFTKNQRQWRISPLKDADRAAWLEKLAELGWEDRTVAHDSYLINLASPDDALFEKSVTTMIEEFERAAKLKVRYLVSHPGAHTGSGLEAGLDRIASAYERIFAEAESDVTLCLENTAGGGSTIGRRFEELARLRELIVERIGTRHADRVGFCIDTCHALAGGYDLTTRPRAKKVIEELDRVCGLEHVRVLHLNDSKGALDSRIDRHEHIGAGEIGLAPFAAFVNHPAFASVPMIMETPKGVDEDGTPFDAQNLERLKSLLSRSRGRKAAARA
jgi:deoxyribonuclease-4